MDSIRWQGNCLALLDQTRLPAQEVWLEYTDYRQLAEAVRRLVVRGVSAVGIAVGYAYCLAAMEFQGQAEFSTRMGEAKVLLDGCGNDSIDLSVILNRMESCLNQYDGSPDQIVALIAEAVTIHRQDVIRNRAMGRLGAEIVPEDANILTACNDGALATGGVGTVLGLVRSAHRGDKVHMVYACETRPLLQGARLTVWELMQDQIPVILITDSAAPSLMAQGKVDLVLLGCDRMAANGDLLHTIGSYSVAISAYFHSIPLYAVLPTTAIDLSKKSGSEWKTEERPSEELTQIGDARTAPLGTLAWNPASDITPHQILTGIITEKGIMYPPFDENIAAIFGSSTEF